MDEPRTDMTRKAVHALLAAMLLFAAVADAYAARDVKRPEEVFRYTASIVEQAIVVSWDIEPGYYLYRDKMKFALDGNALGSPQYPEGELHSDEFFGDQVIFRGQFDVRIPLGAAAGVNPAAQLEVRSQGCADYGLCYPPQTWTTRIADIAPAATTPRRKGLAALLGKHSAADDAAPLPQEQAFIPTVVVPDPFTVVIEWHIEPGYYLYRDSFGFTNPGGEIQLGNPVYPSGIMEQDPEFGDTEVYYDSVSIRIPLSRSSPEPLITELSIDYQGCKKDSICYPPNTVVLPLDLPLASTADNIDTTAPVSEQDRLTRLIASAGPLTIVSVFLGLGLLLAFTPCCLPMVPILSGIIAGQGDNVTTARAFWLSLSYVMGMALTYTLAGALFGAAGGQIQAALQTPLIIGVVAALFVLLSLAMFGLYELQLPAAVQTCLNTLGNKGKAGSFVGTAIMGAVSALVVSTCVAPPLVAALAVIAQTGDVARGAFALFWLSIGMGIPLLIFGTSAGKLLPKTGAWMNAVKAVFGFLLLGLAIWMLDRILPARIIMLLWAALAVFAGVWAGAFTRFEKPAGGAEVAGKTIGILLAVYGVALLLGGLSGATSPLQPLSQFGGGSGQHEAELEFTRIKSVADFETARQAAAADGQTLMLDFYADWCVSCKEMEAWTFTELQVHKALADTTLLQADVTANDDEDKALLEHFGIFGPPTIVFFDREGLEVEGQRVIGYMSADDFLDHLEYALR